MNKAIIKKVSPRSIAAQKTMEALWEDIQTRYGFIAPNPIEATALSGPRSAFWVAFVNHIPVGSIALAPISIHEAELDNMYVTPPARGTGIAHELILVLEEFARTENFTIIKLRTGKPQPEALRFYEKEGFSPIPLFGKWVGDETALCFEKKLSGF